MMTTLQQFSVRSGLGLLLVLPGVGHATDWQMITKDDDGNVYQLDLDSVRSDRGEASGVVRNEYAKPRADSTSGQPVFAALDRLVVDCKTGSFALQSRTLVAADGTELPVIASTRDELTLRPAAAGSLSEAVAKAICRAAIRSGG